jgi:O-antigen/teichoic acid export membrane protein
VQSLTGMVDRYFGYVAWGLVIAAWVVGFVLWIMISGKVKNLTRPFLVCPRCGHTFADKRTAFMMLKFIQPWNWF